MKRIITLTILLASIVFLMHCSAEEEVNVSVINLTLSKETAVLPNDSVIIFTEVLDETFGVVKNIPLEYFANDIPLESNIFYPTEEGTFRMSAKYKDIKSKTKDLLVIDKEKDIDNLILDYQGNNFLTTYPWSLSGTFNYKTKIGFEDLPITIDEIQLYVNGIASAEEAYIFFDDPGEYTFHAEFRNLISNEVIIEVRDQKDYPEIIIPVVFHTYGIDVIAQNIGKLVDTLNGAFSKETYLQESIERGAVDPNAVNMNIRFVAADVAPIGYTLASAGLHIIEPEAKIGEVVDYQEFLALEKEHAWPYNEYMNIWLPNEIDFDGELSGFFTGGTGIATKPLLKEVALEGLETTMEDTTVFWQGIILYHGSVFDEHPDYVVRMMGHFFGLYTTIEFLCNREGDYCEDTFSVDFDRGRGPNNSYYNCGDVYYFPNNHMSFNRDYTNFSYDQRERVRHVLQYGLDRPGE